MYSNQRENLCANTFHVFYCRQFITLQENCSTVKRLADTKKKISKMSKKPTEFNSLVILLTLSFMFVLITMTYFKLNCR